MCNNLQCRQWQIPNVSNFHIKYELTYYTLVLLTLRCNQCHSLENSKLQLFYHSQVYIRCQSSSLLRER